MYEVMARRYRPALFDDVVGQEHIASTLKNAITRDRVAHAFMFTGGHGCGKTTMARILAKALVCEKGPTPDPCCVCPVCVDVAAGRDSDVLEIDGASNNGIEQIRTLRDQAAYVPTRARYKIYIIDEVHMLSDGAFNALLKTLEEPPPHVKFILATTDPHKVPDTILSRCQRYDFRLVPQNKLAGFFRKLAGQENAAITDDALEAVASFAGGSVRDGLVLLDQLLSFADGEVTRQDVENVRGVAAAENVAGMFAHIANADVRAALALVDEVASRGTNVGDFLDQLIAFGRDLMFLVAGGDKAGVSAYGPAKDTLFDLAAKTPLETALLYLDVFAAARTRVRSRALTNPLVSLEMAVARLAGLGGVTPVAEILSRLESLPQSAPVQPPQPVAAPVIPEPKQERNPEPKPMVEPDQPKAVPPPEPPPAAPEPVPEPAPAEEPNPEPAPVVPFDPDPAPRPEPEPPARAAADEGLTMERVKEAWSVVLDRVAENHASDLSYMLRLFPDGVEGDTIRLAGAQTIIEAMEDRLRLGRLTETVTAVLGRPVSFAFVPRRAKASKESARTVARKNYELTNHPAVEKVRSLFDGVVVDFRSAGAPEGAPDDAGEGENE